LLSDYACRAQAFDSQAAGALFSQMMKWRKENSVDAMQDSEVNDEVEEDIK